MLKQAAPIAILVLCFALFSGYTVLTKAAVKVCETAHAHAARRGCARDSSPNRARVPSAVTTGRHGPRGAVLLARDDCDERAAAYGVHHDAPAAAREAALLARA